MGGKTSGYSFFADSCVIVGFSLAAVSSGFEIDSTGATETKKPTGMIGNTLLDRFEVFIDFRNKNLYLKPNSDFEKSYKKTRLGFAYSDRSQTLGGWIVNGFDSNSNAEKSGLSIDDIIISVNNIPVSKISHEKQKHFFDNQKKIA